MATVHDELRRQLGTVGAWTFAFDAQPVADVRAGASALEELGYSALWVPEGSGSRDILTHLSVLLQATERITVASGIANVTARQPEVLQAGIVTLADGFAERPVFGIGVGHEYSTGTRGIDWDRPLARMRGYLDLMDAASSLPAPAQAPQRLLAALGDRMLGLSSERALGAHTYFVPVTHTEHARSVLGPEPVLAVELTAIHASDPTRARQLARAWARHYLELPNYAKNLVRMGFSEDEVTGDGSDRLIDATIAWGDADAVAARVREHLDAGADHVCVQYIDADDADLCLPAYAELAEIALA
ncbi:MAG TPA: TIGR03620 family F420-dependent LLM class oxidoreductase [Actinomycetota bacterium]|jgi:probable F420-dependent oxidoreductase|nr:TIGR03620 family F420-dependent LLM class oxidoreductase [Actinomycetota bacterium]